MNPRELEAYAAVTAGLAGDHDEVIRIAATSVAPVELAALALAMAAAIIRVEARQQHKDPVEIWRAYTLAVAAGDL